MRVLAYVLMGVLLGMGLMSFFQDRGQHFSSSSLSYAMPTSDQETVDSKPWTGEDLLKMATIYDQQADELQSEAVRLEQRA